MNKILKYFLGFVVVFIIANVINVIQGYSIYEIWNVLTIGGITIFQATLYRSISYYILTVLVFLGFGIIEL